MKFIKTKNHRRLFLSICKTSSTDLITNSFQLMVKLSKRNLISLSEQFLALLTIGVLFGWLWLQTKKKEMVKTIEFLRKLKFPVVSHQYNELIRNDFKLIKLD